MSHQRGTLKAGETHLTSVRPGVESPRRTVRGLSRGGGGIRTHGAVRLTRLSVRPVRPLRHASAPRMIRAGSDSRADRTAHIDCGVCR